MTENEFVYVYFGMLRGDPKPDPPKWRQSNLRV